MKTGFDSIAASVAEWQSLVPANPEVIGAYINGLYANDTSAREAFPDAIHYTYDVTGGRPDADVLDVEPLDATIPQCPGWYHAWLVIGAHTLPKPTFYISASSVAAVAYKMGVALAEAYAQVVGGLIGEMTAAGISRSEYLILSAHYNGVEHVCGPSTCGYPQADGTQWDDHGAQGQNTDRLLYNDNFFGVTPPPTPPEEEDMATVVAFNNAPNVTNGHVEVFTINNSANPSHKWVQTDGTWSNWTPMDCPTDLVELTEPKIHPDGHAEIWGKGTDGNVYHSWQDSPGGTWANPWTRF